MARAQARATHCSEVHAFRTDAPRHGSQMEPSAVTRRFQQLQPHRDGPAVYSLQRIQEAGAKLLHLLGGVGSSSRQELLGAIVRTSTYDLASAVDRPDAPGEIECSRPVAATPSRLPVSSTVPGTRGPLQASQRLPIGDLDGSSLNWSTGLPRNATWTSDQQSRIFSPFARSSSL